MFNLIKPHCFCSAHGSHNGCMETSEHSMQGGVMLFRICWKPWRAGMHGSGVVHLYCGRKLVVLALPLPPGFW